MLVCKVKKQKTKKKDSVSMKTIKKVFSEKIKM
jgi:hypothetical protein